MAVEALFACTEVTKRAGGREVACRSDADGAMPTSEWSKGFSGGVPAWLMDSDYVTYDPDIQSAADVILIAVPSKGPGDPNLKWALATPSGKLTMTIHNPDAFDTFEPGATYKLKVTRQR